MSFSRHPVLALISFCRPVSPYVLSVVGICYFLPLFSRLLSVSLSAPLGSILKFRPFHGCLYYLVLLPGLSWKRSHTSRTAPTDPSFILYEVIFGVRCRLSILHRIGRKFQAPALSLDFSLTALASCTCRWSLPPSRLNLGRACPCHRR